MGALLSFIPGKDLFYGALVVALVIFGVYERNHLIAEGQQHELAALKASSDRLQKKADQDTAELQAKANMAEQAYDKEHALIVNQSVPVVRLCSPTNSGGSVSKAGTVVAGNASAGSAAPSVQQVPTGDTGVAGPDLGGMLSALASSADQVSATLREYQNRGQR